MLLEFILFRFRIWIFATVCLTGLRHAANGQATISNPTGNFRNFNPVPASPNVASFQKYGDLPVNLNTGIPQIEVPLYTITMKDFSWPINLSYHASGFKSEDIASRVGLGWVLDGTGVISTKQSLIGAGNGVDGSRWLNLSGYTHATNFTCVYSNQTDIDLADAIAEGRSYVSPEFIYINAGPLNGRSLNGAFFLPSADIKVSGISIGSTPDSIKWIVNDDKGIVYEFGEMGYNYRASSCPGVTSLQVNPAYYLTKIKTPAGDSIVFVYNSENYTYSQTPLHVVKTVVANQLSGCYIGLNDENYYCQNQYTAFEKKLNSIETSTGTFIRFNYSSRNDLIGCTKMDSISIQYKKGSDTTLIRTIKLLQSYFGTGSDPYGLQLKLNEVIYKGSDNSTESGYRFYYDESSALPHKLSESINGGPGSMSAFYNITKAGILKKLVYPTGGYTSFDYDVITGYGVLRIKEISDFDTLHLQTGFRRFDYHDTPPTDIDGVLTETEDIKYWGNPYNNSPDLSTVSEGNYCAYTPRYDLIVQCSRTIWKNQVVRNTLQDLMEASPRYSYITEYYGSNGENGKTDYVYGAYDYGARPVNDIPYLSKPEMLKEKKVYKNTGSGYSLINQTTNQYEVPGCGTDLFETTSSAVESRFWIKKVYLTRNEMTLCNSCFVKEYLETTFRITSLPLYLKQTTERIYNNLDSLSVTTKYFYTDSTHLKQTRTEAISSKGDTIKTFYKYPHDFAGSAVYDQMISRNMILPVEILAYRNSTLHNRLRNDYKIWNASMILQSSIERSVMGNALDTEVVINKYDNHGNVFQLTGREGLLKSYIWDYRSAYPVAECTNADSASIAYTSFEADGKGNWSFSGTPASDPTSPTGKMAYVLNGSNNITKSGLSSGSTYIVSYWTKNSSAFTITGTISGYPIAGSIVDGWKFFEHRITGQTQVTISGSGSIDELRLYPIGALMTSYTFNPLVGMTTVCDQNNRINYYQYDVSGRLSLIRDQDKNIIKRVCYNYAGHPDACQAGPITYYNSTLTKDFTRNNCGAGYQPTSVTNTVSFGTYTSQISQRYVDSLAQVQMNANGPSNANSNGYCLLIYHNVQKSDTFTRNNCGPDYIGSNVIYIVPADTYNSTISQPYVDSLALNAVNANGQAYANSHGTCTLICTGENCTSEGFACINGTCEYGQLVATYCEYDSLADTWHITYHYEWSDESWSDDYHTNSAVSWCF